MAGFILEQAIILSLDKELLKTFCKYFGETERNIMTTGI